MRYVEAINDYDLYGTDKKVFLAGGITGCPDCNHAKFTTDYDKFVEGSNDRMQLTLFEKDENE